MKIRKVSKRMLAGLLCLSLLAGLFPGLQLVPVAQAASDGTTVDAFGITMYQFDEQARLEAEQATPLGVGYGTRSALLAKHELFINNAANQNTQRAGVIDLNGSTASDEDAVSKKVTSINMDTQLTRTGAPYRFLESAAFNPGTGRDEYVVQLGYKVNALDLILTDATNNQKLDTVTINPPLSTGENFAHLNALSGYRVAGSIAVCCGDFDGDGVDSIIAFIPELGFNNEDDHPYIVEYTYNGSELEQKRFVVEDLWDLLDLPHIQDVSANSCPRVSLVAEDTDLDGFDELVITASVGDTPYADNSGTYEGNLGSQLFVYELYDGDFDESEGAAPNPTWHQSAHFELSADKKTANEPYRIVWASATVGNLIASTSTTEADYPEIFAAGYIDQSASANGWHIDVGDTNMGYSIMRVADNTKRETYPTGQLLDPENEKSNGYAQNVVCTYEMLVQDQQVNNEFTQDGFYTDEETWGIFQVQAFADRGVNSAESVFVSGSVYRVIDSGKLQKMTDNTYFDTSDNAAPGSTILAQTSVMDVIAGNFDGNDYGREQIICVTALKKATVNYQDYSRIYYIYNLGDRVDEEDESTTTATEFHCDEGPYVASSQRPMYISLAAVDNDDDSVVVQLEEVTRSYTEPDVLAILEAPPYFAEIEPSTDNSATVYGNSSMSGGGYGNSFGFNAGVIVGAEPALFATGPSWELSINNTFNWGFSHTTSTEIFQEFSNDSGENQVVVYRCPVVNYKYVDEDGNAIVISKPGQPALSTITEQEYNDAVAQYTAANLDPIPEGMLGTAGDPDSYRSNEYGLSEYIGANTSSTQQGANWVQYNGGSTITQGITVSQEDQRDFDYNLDIDFQITGEVLGAYAGGQFGLHYEHETSSFNGTSVTKSGSVTSQKVAGYDFQWKFAAWDVKLNGQSVPVLGYLVQNVEAPPSPAANLDVETVGTDTATLAWQAGTRAAQEYRIYRVFDNGRYTLLGAVDGSEVRYTLTGLKPGETYTYVVRGVAYEADGDAVESVDSAPVMVITRELDAADVGVVITGTDDDTETDKTVTSSGARIALRASAVDTGHSLSLSYNWQLRRAGGLSNWEDLSESVSGVGSATGATTGSLTLENVDLALDGAQLRCVVTAVSQDGTPNYYYSDTVTMNLSRERTTTTLTAEGSLAGKGTAKDPYTGYADYTTSEAGEPVVTNVPVTIDAEEEVHPALSVYQETGETGTVYIGVGTDALTGESVYYALEASAGSYTVGEALTFGDLTWEGAPEGFDGTPEEEDGYQRMALLETPVDESGEATGEPLTFTEYWMKEEGSEENLTVGYYTRNDGTFTPVDDDTLETITNGDLRTVFVVPETSDPSPDETLAADSTLILDLPEPPKGQTYDPNQEWYIMYTVGSGNKLTEGKPFSSRQDGNLYKSGEAYADPANMTAVTERVEQTTTVTASNPGTSLTLTATVSPASGAAIDYTITNLSTGVSSTQRAGTDGKLTWQATAAGLYRITAAAQAAGSYAGSTATLYYQAGAVSQEGTEEYRLLLQLGDKNVDSLVYGGQEVTPVLEKRTAATVGDNGTPAEASEWAKVDSFTYTVNNEAGSGDYAVDGSGTFLFTAYVQEAEGETTTQVAVASAQLEVTRADITISPTWANMDTDGTVPEFGDIQRTPTPAGAFVETDMELLKTAIDVRCSLYDDEGVPTATGLFDVTLQYRQSQEGDTEEEIAALNAAIASLQSKYTITFEKAQILRPASAVTVTYGAGTNGTIGAYYINGADFSLTNSQSVPITYGLKFTALANEGFRVSAWQIQVGGTVIDLDQDSLEGCYAITPHANGEILRIDSIAELLEAVETELDGPLPSLHVSVTFTNESHTVTFSQSGSGTITAAQNGHALSSGITVAGGSSVTFTATPESDDYVVESWTVNNVRQDNDDGTPFTGTELTLDAIDADTHVTVTFVEAEYFTVGFTAVDPDGNPLTSGVTLTTEGVEDGQARQGTQVTLIAEPTPGNAVLEWQQKNEENKWVTIAQAQSSYTIQSIQSDVEIRVVVSNSGTTYAVTFGVVDRDGAELTEDGGTLSAQIGGNVIVSGSSQLAGSNHTCPGPGVTAYEVGEWTVNGEEVTPTCVDDATRTYTYEYQNLITALELKVTVRKLDTYNVTYSVADTGTGGHGSLSASYDRKGMESYKIPELTSGGDGVYEGGTLTFTATPETGYRVYEWRVNGEKQPETGKTLTLEAQNANVTVQFTELGSKITAEVAGAGSLTAVQGTTDLTGQLTDGFTLASDAQVTFTATPETGYEVQGWYVNGEIAQSGGATFAYTAQEDGVGAHILVRFQPVVYAVSWGGENGAVAADGYEGDSAEIRGGTDVTFTAEAAEGYAFAGWMVNGETVEDATSATFRWTVPTGAEAGTEYDIAAIFSRGSYEVTIGQPGNATITMVPAGPVTGGTQATFTAEVEEGYLLTGWTVNDETTETFDTSYRVTIQGPTTVTARIVPSHYNVSFSAGEGGSIAAADYDASPASVPYGESITFTATPETYYHISGWSVDGEAVPDSANLTSYTLENVTANTEVAVIFAAAVAYDVGYEAGEDGSLSATANGEALNLTPDQTEPVWGGSKLVFEAQPEDGQMLTGWTVNGAAVTRTNMGDYGMDHPLMTTLTVASLSGNLRVEAQFGEYVGYAIPESQNGYEIQVVTRNPVDGESGEIREGGDLTFTVSANAGDGYVTLSTLVINGYDCLTGEGTPTGCEAVTAEVNPNGSYTVTITGVNAEIVADIEAHQLMITPGLEGYQIPEALENAGFGSVEQIQTALAAKVTGSEDTTTYLDIALMYWVTDETDPDGGYWAPVTEENFPEEGVDVLLPYEEISATANLNSKDSFQVVHMISMGADAGKVETIEPEKTDTGLHFHVDTLSPFAVSWEKYVAPTPSGGGGGGMMSGFAITVLPSERGTLSASATNAAAGQEITVTLEALSGYAAGGITVTDEQGNPVAVTGSGGVYRFTMPESAVTVRGQFLCLGEDNPNCPSLDFTDLNANQWYHEAVDYVLTRGLMNGMGDDIFDPNGSLTRAMLVQILWRLEGQPVVNYLLPFTDVEDDDWYTEAVRWAASEGIVNGVSETSFAPDEAITREQLATMLHRYAKGKGYEAPSGGMAIREFKDYAEISSWALQSMHWAVDSGLMNGKGDDILDPTGTATRAEVSKILSVFCQNFDL